MKRGFLFLAAILASAGSAQAIVVNLTTAASVPGSINGAIYARTAQGSSGSGVINSFVRVGGNNEFKRGYNTDARPVEFDEDTTATFTRSLNLSSVPIVTIGVNTYREFLLDINQTGANPNLTLANVQLRLGTTGALGGAGVNGYGSATFLAATTSVYDMNATAWNGTGPNPHGNSVELNASLSSGSGYADMFMYVPTTAFTGINQFVYLYSEFGAPTPNNDGYEEWAVQDVGQVIPLPPSALTGGGLLAGLIGLGVLRRRK